MTGSGTLADPYIIWDVNDLQAVSNDLAAYYELGCDIDASATAGWNGGLGFLPIGLWVNWGVAVPPGPFTGCAGVNWKQTPFTGHFDGKGYSITGLVIHRTRILPPTTTCPDYHDVGLFSQIVAGVVVRVVENVHLINIDIDGYQSVGGLVGYAYGNATITNCTSSGSVNAENLGAGGLVGSAYSITIEDSSSSTTVTGDHEAGGLVGYANTSTINDSYATGNVTTVSTDAGGLIGEGVAVIYNRCFATGDVLAGTNYSGGLIGYSWGDTISNCYARGNVTGNQYVGGLVGILRGVAGLGTIENSYSTGLVIGVGLVGGLVGSSSGSSNGCFWDTQTSGQAASGEGTGKTTSQMKTKSTFTDVGWDFSTIWGMRGVCNSGYPCLKNVTPLCVITPIVITNEAIQ